MPATSNVVEEEEISINESEIKVESVDVQEDENEGPKQEKVWFDYKNLARISYSFERNIWMLYLTFIYIACLLLLCCNLEKEGLLFLMPFHKKSNIPMQCIFLYYLLIGHHCLVFICRITQKIKSKQPRSFSLYGIRNNWRVVTQAHLKLWSFVSCCYFIYRIEDSDGIKEGVLTFGQIIPCLIGSHILFFMCHLWLRSDETLSELFRYVPTIPSIGLLCYSQYRCYTSDKIKTLGDEDVALFYNNALILITFLYEDFWLRKPSDIMPLHFAKGRKLDLFNFKCERKLANYEMAIKNKCDKKYFQYTTLPWLLNDFIFPSFFLVQNYVFAVNVHLESRGLYINSWLLGLFCVYYSFWQSKSFSHYNAIPLIQVVCYFSLHCEIPKPPEAKLATYMSYEMDDLSCFMFVMCTILFLFQVCFDINYGRIADILDFSRTLFYWSTYRNPSNDWEKICRTLSYIKNIDEFDIKVNEKGEVFLEFEEEEGKCTNGDTYGKLNKK